MAPLYNINVTGFRKMTKLSHFVFREIPFLNIEAAVALLCSIIAMQDLLYK